MEDKVGSREDVNAASVTEDSFNTQTNTECSLLLPPLPRIHPSLPALYPPSDQAYVQAAAIFQQLRRERTVKQQYLPYRRKTDEPQLDYRDQTTQRQAYQLAFNTLKYQDLLEDIITDCCFHTAQHISSSLLPLAMVMLFDFQDRKFVLYKCLPKEVEQPLQEVRNMESSLQRYKTKLAASFARRRVKQRLRSLSCFLSDPVRTKQYRAKHLPLYVWVNTLKRSVEEVCKVFQSAGLCEVKNMTDLGESTFCRDPLCPDTLVFSQQLHALLQQNSLADRHVIHTQDRSVCLAVSVLRPLLFAHGDVLLIGFFSALTVAHVAVVAAARCGRVLVCGADHTPARITGMRELFTQMDIKNVKVLSEAYCGLREWAAAIQNLKVIIVLPRCSSSALSDPVPIIHSEHGELDLLSDLSHGSVSQSKIYTLATQQARLLMHALSFQKVQTVVYCTRSVYPEENEQVVKRVLEKIHTHPKLLPFRVNGPIFPNDSSSGDTTDSKFFRLKPSQLTNGCFVARLSRQADPTKVESVQDVLARAAAKGLLGAVIPEPSKTCKKEKDRKDGEDSFTSKPSSSLSQGRKTGNELENGQVSPEVKEENSEDEKKKVHAKKNRRGLQGSKRKVKRRTKQSNGVSKHPPKDRRMKQKKVHQSHHRRHLTGSKKRKIPRLKVALISHAKPSSHLSSITTLAHKLRENVAYQHTTVFSGNSPAPAPPAPHLTARQRQNPEPGRAEKTLKGVKAGRTLRTRAQVVGLKTEVVTQVRSKAAEFVLPPISFTPYSSLSSKSDTCPSQHRSQASKSQFV